MMQIKGQTIVFSTHHEADAVQCLATLEGAGISGVLAKSTEPWVNRVGADTGSPLFIILVPSHQQKAARELVREAGLPDTSHDL